MTHGPTGDKRDIATLLKIMRALRAPDGGCPWDLEQDFSTIAPHTIEEAYEVADAIARGSMADLCDELGDLLLQVVDHAQMAAEDGAFTFADVVEAICLKLVRRHPHVFGDAEARSAGAVKGMWEDVKAEERRAKSGDNVTAAAASVVDDVPHALPALMRAEKLQKRAARVGFDWPHATSVFDKIAEEVAELRDAQAKGDLDAIAEECGDLLFAVSNIARHLGVDPEVAMRAANTKFERRFRSVEAVMANGGTSPPWSLADMDAAWDDAKRRERG